MDEKPNSANLSERLSLLDIIDKRNKINNKVCFYWVLRYYRSL